MLIRVTEANPKDKTWDRVYLINADDIFFVTKSGYPDCTLIKFLRGECVEFIFAGRGCMIVNESLEEIQALMRDETKFHNE